jgi:hypothetical protein
VTGTGVAVGCGVAVGYGLGLVVAVGVAAVLGAQAATTIATSVVRLWRKKFLRLIGCWFMLCSTQGIVLRIIAESWRMCLSDRPQGAEESK